MTVFEHIEKLKRDYTDKFVLVDDRCAELARFKGQTGRVKTVNMNGRALVEFDHYSNIGWFDIDVDYLKVIDRPAPVEKKAAKADRAATKKPTVKSTPTTTPADKKLSPLEMARMQDSGAKSSAQPAASKEMSIAEKLAAARGSADSKAKPQDAASEEMTIAEKLAAARGNSGAGKKPAPDDETGSKASASDAPVKDASTMSIAEKLAAARGNAGSAPTKETGSAEVADEPGDVVAADASESRVDSPADAATEGETAAAEEATVEAVDRANMSVEEMVAWCRKHDG